MIGIKLRAAGALAVGLACLTSLAVFSEQVGDTLHHDSLLCVRRAE